MGGLAEGQAERAGQYCRKMRKARKQKTGPGPKTSPAGSMEAAGGIEPPNKGFADLSLSHLGTPPTNKMERETGLEPATSTLARWRSTTELFPLGYDYFIFVYR
jgi:hypothetical protein